jgi:hypothetical protein
MKTQEAQHWLALKSLQAQGRTIDWKHEGRHNAQSIVERMNPSRVMEFMWLTIRFCAHYGYEAWKEAEQAAWDSEIERQGGVPERVVDAVCCDRCEDFHEGDELSDKPCSCGGTYVARYRVERKLRKESR